jgi:hypothetical protein
MPYPKGVRDESITSHKIDDDKETREEFDFGVKDSKGRALGSRVFKGRDEFVEIDEAHRRENQYAVGYHVRPGSYFYFRPSATRDGKHYGAWHYPSYFHTAQERDAAVAKYVANARKRAAKNAAK